MTSPSEPTLVKQAEQAERAIKRIRAAWRKRELRINERMNTEVQAYGARERALCDNLNPAVLAILRAAGVVG